MQVVETEFVKAFVDRNAFSRLSPFSSLGRLCHHTVDVPFYTSMCRFMSPVSRVHGRLLEDHHTNTHFRSLRPILLNIINNNMAGRGLTMAVTLDTEQIKGEAERQFGASVL